MLQANFWNANKYKWSTHS